MIYCPYTNKELEDTQVSPEHIIPLSLGGMNGFEIPVCKEFNSKVGYEVDGKIGQELIIQSRRTKLKVKGHSNNVPSMYYKNACDIESGLTLQVRITKDKGIKAKAPYVPKDTIPPTGKKIQFSTTSDMEIWLKYTAKVALSAGYFAYGDKFRYNVNTDELRTILTMSHDEIRKHNPDIKTQAHYLYLEDELKEIKLYKKICEAVGDHSCVGIIPSDNHLTFFTGILGGYVGMIRVEAKTEEFPNENEYRWGHFICPQYGQLSRVSFHRLLKKLFEQKN